MPELGKRAQLLLQVTPDDGPEEIVTDADVQAYIDRYDRMAREDGAAGREWSAGVASRAAAKARQALAARDAETLARLAEEGYLGEGGATLGAAEEIAERQSAGQESGVTVEVLPGWRLESKISRLVPRRMVVRAVRRSPRRRERRRSPSRAGPRRSDDPEPEPALSRAYPAGGAA